MRSRNSYPCSRVPYLLVGTKRDLRKDAAFDVIEHKEGHDLASQIEAEGYFEISALTLNRASKECLMKPSGPA